MLEQIKNAIQNIAKVQIKGVSLTKEVLFLLLIWLIPVIIGEIMLILAVFFDYKPDVMYRFLPIDMTMFEKMWSIAGIAGLLALIKIRKDKDADGIPDELEERDNNEGN